MNPGNDHPLLKGRWVLHWPEGQHPTRTHRALLDWLHDVAVDLGRGPRPRTVRIRLGSDVNEPCRFESGHTLFLGMRAPNFPLPDPTPARSIARDPLPRRKPLRRILLLTPAAAADRRWRSISLPCSSLILGASLAAEGFTVHSDTLPLPSGHIRPHWLDHDMIGLTVYEDLLEDVLPLLHRLRAAYGGLIAAGGPMVTLNPLPALYHLEGVNLWVRGEAEFVLPRLLRALNRARLPALLRQSGFAYFDRGVAMISGFSHVHRPGDFSSFSPDLSFLEPSQLKHGLELNVSRGCHRRCHFCSRPQGNGLRALPPETVSSMLQQVDDRLRTLTITAPQARTVNINDDDILQDLDLAGRVFQEIRRRGFTLWGVQTSISSLITRNGVRQEAIASIEDPELYAGASPLLWIGTDAFLSARSRRLGKKIPGRELITGLIAELDARRIRNHHYWISSDHETDWTEFIDELLFLVHLRCTFGHFGILAHSPFLIPYPSTPLFRRLSSRERRADQLRSRQTLRAGRAAFAFEIMDRVLTRHPYLNRLLQNEAPPAGGGFFTLLKHDDMTGALATAYHFLRQERMGRSDPGTVDRLTAAEGRLEQALASPVNRGSPVDNPRRLH